MPVVVKMPPRSQPQTPPPVPPSPSGRGRWARRGLAALAFAGVGTVGFLNWDVPEEVPKNDAVSIVCRSMSFLGADKPDPCRFFPAVASTVQEAHERGVAECNAYKGGMVGLGNKCQQVGGAAPDSRKLAVIYWATASGGDVTAHSVTERLSHDDACALAGFTPPRCPSTLGVAYNF